MENTNCKIRISGYGSISPLGSEMTEIAASYTVLYSLLSEKQFNGNVYNAGFLNNKTEHLLNDFISSDSKFKRLDRSVQMAVYAASKAMLESKIDANKRMMGVSIGSSRGATGLFEKYYSEYLKNSNNQTSLLTSPLTTLGNISSSVAQYIGAKGFVMSHSMTCSTALQAVTNAVAWIKSGMADSFIVGGAEAPLTPFTFAQLEALGIYSKEINTDYPCRPMTNEENKKNTMTLGEGAAIFVLEKVNSKDIKCGDIIIESVGFGFEEIPSATGLTDEGDTLFESMTMALKNTTSGKVDAIITHSPGTIKGDAAEFNAITRIFGNELPVLYNNKWKIGHTYGASGAFSMETAILLLKELIKPILPYEVRYKNPTRTNFNSIMVNSAGFGGNSSSVILKIVK